MKRFAAVAVIAAVIAGCGGGSGVKQAPGLASGMIAFSTDQGITMIHPDGTGQVTVTNNPTDTDPAISPDGNKIAFAGSDGIYVVNADGTGRTKLASKPGENRHPDFSPDSKTIVFESCERDDYGSGGDMPAPPPTSHSDVFIVNVDGTGLRRLGVTPDNVFPKFAKDGVHLTYGIGSDQFMANLNTSEVLRLSATTSDRHAFDMDYSPDGNQRVYSNCILIYTSDVDGGNAVKIATPPNSAQLMYPIYSPDGATIAFSAECFDHFSPAAPSDLGIYVMNIDGTNMHKIADGKGPISWAP